MEKDPNLPDLYVENAIESITIPATDPDDPDLENSVTRGDLILSDAMLSILCTAWPQVRSVGQICKLIDATVKAVKHRRDILELPYGPRAKTPRTFDIPTLD